MLYLIELLVLIVGFFVAWNIGANNTANCVGVSVGSRILSYRQAIAIAIIFVILGTTLEGWKNMKTVGEGIILSGPTGENPLSAVPYAAVASLIASGLWMLFATLLGLPMSVSLSTVGAVMGAGFLISVFYPGMGVGLNYGKLGAIVISWILNPLIAAAASLAIFKTVSLTLHRIRNVLMVNQVLKIFILVASAYSAYALGANDVGTSVGVVYAFFGGSLQVIA
ncbi:MAG: inorganic phosphate transporter, partial [Methanobacteriota archaeon]